MIQVALVDDHAVIRKGIKASIELHSSIKVVLEASNGEEFLQLLSRKEILPDVVIMDISMPKLNGADTTEKLKRNYSSIHIIVFSLIAEEDTILNMINKGASSFIHKSADPTVLSEAIVGVYKTGFYFSDWVKRNYFNLKIKKEKKSGFNGKHYLTEKELLFMKLAASNLNYQEISFKMKIRPKTLENYRDSLFQKLDINNRTALVIYGIKNGIISV